MVVCPRLFSHFFTPVIKTHRDEAWIGPDSFAWHLGRFFAKGHKGLI
jgi:hypothetical protein